MTRDRLIALLAKLDALAERPGTPEEGDAARKRAAMIREKHAAVLAATPPPVVAPGYAYRVVAWSGTGANRAARNIVITFNP